MDISGQQCKISSWRSSRFVMWVPPNHLLNPIRLLFILLWGAVSIFFWKKENKFTFHQVALRETFELLDNPECDKLGRQSWVVITIVVTELLICIKFGWATITKPLPRHIALWWVLGAALLLVYTVVKFYLLKPNHVPQPEKEHIRVGSPLGSSTGMQRCLWNTELANDQPFSWQGRQWGTEIHQVWKEARGEREINWREMRTERRRKTSETELSQIMQSLFCIQSDELNFALLVFL